jgi:hypothetical protein
VRRIAGTDLKGDFWKGVPLLPSIPLLCIVSRDSRGHTCFILPPCPAYYMGGLNFSGYVDPIKHKDTWLSRESAHLPGAGPDGKYVIARNIRLNRENAGGKHQDWKQLWGREKGKTALMVSCGPSLSDSLPELAPLLADKERFFSITLNRGLGAIDADYFVSMDHRGGMDWITRSTGHTKLLSSVTANADVASEFPKENRYFGDTFLEGSDEGLAPLREGLAITLPLAMHAAYLLGATELWLYGADFALSGYLETEDGLTGEYKLDKYYYDQLSHEGLAFRAHLHPNMYPVRDIRGGMCMVNYELWAYASFTMAMVYSLEGAGCKVKNKSRSGILDWRINE